METSSVNKIGYQSSILSLIFAMGYIIPQLLSEFKVIPHPQDLFWLFLPSLFLAPAFLVTMICLDYIADNNLRIWTTIGWAFAAVYCVMVAIVYFVQLTVVIPHQLKGELDSDYVLLFEPKAFLTAVDCLGYFFMSMSTLFAAFAFKNTKQKWLYYGLFWNGALLPVLILAFFYPFFYYIGAIWMFTFPVAMIHAARQFRLRIVTLPIFTVADENK